MALYPWGFTSTITLRNPMRMRIGSSLRSDVSQAWISQYLPVKIALWQLCASVLNEYNEKKQ